MVGGCPPPDPPMHTYEIVTTWVRHIKVCQHLQYSILLNLVLRSKKIWDMIWDMIHITFKILILDMIWYHFFPCDMRYDIIPLFSRYDPSLSYTHSAMKFFNQSKVKEASRTLVHEHRVLPGIARSTDAPAHTSIAAKTTTTPFHASFINFCLCAPSRV